MARNFQFGVTQRHEFSTALSEMQDDQPGPSSQQGQSDVTANGDQTEKKEKRRCMGLKYAAFSIVVCGLLAGVIVAVVYGVKYLPKKDKQSLGAITPGETPIVECPDAVILHGAKIEFACDFSKNEGVKSAWNNIDWNKTKVDYPPSNVNKSDIMCQKTGNNGSYVMRCNADSVTRATCSNNGKITLTLKTTTGFVTYSTSFAMILQEKNIIASTPIVNNASGSVSVSCSVNGVCKSYQMHIYAYEKIDQKTRIDGPQFKCESSFNNTNGHTIDCTDEIKGEHIPKDIRKITCALVDGVKEEQEKEIQFPFCCEKKVQAAVNCTADCRNCTSACPECNRNIWCRPRTNTIITGKDLPFDICETMNTLNCTSNSG